MPTGPSSVATAEDTPLAFTLSATDTEGDPLTYARGLRPGERHVVCSTDGSCMYTPAPNFNGADVVHLVGERRRSHGQRRRRLSTSRPSTTRRWRSTSRRRRTRTPRWTCPLLATDAEGDTHHLLGGEPAGRRLGDDLPGNIATYTPNADYSGTDSFTYRATDPHGAFTTARVSLVVNEVALIGTSLVRRRGGGAGAGHARRTEPGDLVVFPKLRATLRTASGAPLVGRTISFSVGGTPVCSATTNAQGAGTCSATIPLVQGPAQPRLPGELRGRPGLRGEHGRGPLVQVLQLRL